MEEGSPIPPSLPGPAPASPAAAAPRPVSSYIDPAVTIGPPASQAAPLRATVSAARPIPSAPKQLETERVQPPPPPTPTPAFAWPPTAEEDTIFAQQLYGDPGTGARRRLPVFQAICPGPPEVE